MAQGKAAVLLMALLLLAATGLLGGGWTSGGMRVEGVFRYPKQQLLCWLGILLVSLWFVLLLCCF